MTIVKYANRIANTLLFPYSVETIGGLSLEPQQSVELMAGHRRRQATGSARSTAMAALAGRSREVEEPLPL